MRQSRRSIINRAIRLIKLFETGRPITAKQVGKELNISKRNAYRWIDELSVEMPIYEYKIPDMPISRLNPIQYVMRNE